MTRKELLTPTLPFKVKKRFIWPLLIVFFLITLFLPWIAFTTGEGLITAINPNERVQSITAPVSGFIRRWNINEGQYVKKGQIIAVLTDNDPNLLERYQREKEAAKATYNSAKLMLETSKKNLNRQEILLKQGLSARKDFEKAKIDYSKLQMDLAKAEVLVIKAETQLSRQASQEVKAPRDGYVVRILPGEQGQLIKAGEAIAVFSPEVTQPAVEMWVDGTDTPMVQVGQSARVQFEGWPSLQIPGWPSVAINTFKAKVYLVDQASSYKGRFRVLLIPDGKWPSSKILRLGIHAKGYVEFSKSYVIREVWRKLNNIPPVYEPIYDELQRILDNKDKK